MPVKYDLERDPAAFTDAEQEMADAINEAAQRDRSDVLTGVALGLGASFLLYRRYMSRRLKEQVAAAPRFATSTDAMAELATRTMAMFMPGWQATLAVNLTVGYAQGMNEVKAGGDIAWARAAADSYARSLGKSVNDVSVQAMVEGIQSQVNRGVPIRVAVDRVIDAFGVAPRTMKALVNIWTRGPVKDKDDKPLPSGSTSQKITDRVKDAIDKRIAKALTERAATIGDTEAYLSRNAAKSMYWAWQAENGEIPAAAEKEWVTADDEFVCKVCGPLHGVRVLVTDRFSSSVGPLMAPGVHPRCRCSLRLHLNLDMSDFISNPKRKVSKARGDDKYDRDSSGQFASTESRGAKKIKPRDRFRQYGDQAKAHARPKQSKEEDVTPSFGTSFVTDMGGSFGQKMGTTMGSSMSGTSFASADLRQQKFAPARFEAMDLAVSDVTSRTMEVAQMALAETQKTSSAKKVITIVSGYGGSIQSDEDADVDYMHAVASSSVGDILYELADNVFEEARQGSQWEDDNDFGAPWSEEGTDPEEIYDQDGPSEEWLRSNLVNPYTDDTFEASETQHYRTEFIRVSLQDGRNAYLTRDTVAEAVENVWRGNDSMIPINVAPSGSGFVAGETGITHLSTSDLITAMGTSGGILVNDAVRARTIAVVSDEDSPLNQVLENGEYYDSEETEWIENVYEEMSNDPFNTSWVDESYEL